MRHVVALALLPSLFFVAGPASAFTEDICYPSTGGIVTCTPLPAACQPAGTETQACKDAAIVTFTQASNQPDARSTVHVDAPYIAAQVVGFSSDDAYWIAAYSEATDRGTFEPRDETGALVGGGALKTATLTGLERTDFTSGGIYVHFAAPRSATAAPVAGIDGLDPDPTDADHEVMLTHLRTWAMAGSGAARPDCAAGLTNPSATGDDATGATCWIGPAGPATVHGAVTLFDGPGIVGMTTTKTFDVQTGLQIIQDDGAGTTATSDTFDTVIGVDASRVADARLGVYIHAFGDRISHHVCLDASYLVGPTDGGATWTADMTSAACSQGLHTLRHIWETGVDFSLLAAEDRTTEAYLGEMFDQLAAFAAARGVASSAATDPAARASLVADLEAAEQIVDVTARLAALRDATCARGLAAFPGEAACPPPSTTATGAGGSGGAGGASSGAGGEGGASSSSGGPTTTSTVASATSSSASVASSTSATSGAGAAGTGAGGGDGGASESSGCAFATSGGDRGGVGAALLALAAALASTRRRARGAATKGGAKA